MFRAYLACLMRKIYTEEIQVKKLLLSYDLNKGPSGVWKTERVYDEKICTTESSKVYQLKFQLLSANDFQIVMLKSLQYKDYYIHLTMKNHMRVVVKFT